MPPLVLVAVCLKRGAVPIGGMATALPSKVEEVNRAAAAAIRADKEWEAQQGFIRGWVAHIFHMQTAAEPFQALRASGWKPTPVMARPVAPFPTYEPDATCMACACCPAAASSSSAAHKTNPTLPQRETDELGAMTGFMPPLL